MEQGIESAVFGGGCFWCVEAVFQRLRGVISVMPGYADGATKNPTYKEICTGRTGHAEVARIEFNPSDISFRDLLTVFFATHDPTTLNRQGNDVGTQYRSTILYSSEEQKRVAEEVIAKKNNAKEFPQPIVTQVKSLDVFYPAEDYHRNYFNDNPDQPYCTYIIDPKITKLQKKFADRLK